MPAIQLRRYLLSLALFGFGCAPPVPIPLTPAPAPATDTVSISPRATETWTVRLQSSADPTEAEEFASQAQPRFDTPLSIVRSGGESHVQVGRFLSREEASAFQEVARERGYRFATAIRTVDPDPDPESED